MMYIVPKACRRGRSASEIRKWVFLFAETGITDVPLSDVIDQETYSETLCN